MSGGALSNSSPRDIHVGERPKPFMWTSTMYGALAAAGERAEISKLYTLGLRFFSEWSTLPAADAVQTACQTN